MALDRITCREPTKLGNHWFFPKTGRPSGTRSGNLSRPENFQRNGALAVRTTKPPGLGGEGRCSLMNPVCHFILLASIWTSLRKSWRKKSSMSRRLCWIWPMTPLLSSERIGEFFSGTVERSKCMVGQRRKSLAKGRRIFYRPDIRSHSRKRRKPYTHRTNGGEIWPTSPKTEKRSLLPPAGHCNVTKMERRLECC